MSNTANHHLWCHLLFSAAFILTYTSQLPPAELFYTGHARCTLAGHRGAAS